jgi:hypothetical protein
VDITQKASWLKVEKIKTIKENRQYEITFKFDKKAIGDFRVTNYAVPYFVGKLLINVNNIQKEIPVYVYTNSKVYEDIEGEVNIFVYEKNEYEENDNPKAVFTTTTSAEKNFNFDIEDLEDGKEYVVIATTDKNWDKNPKGEYLLGQAFIKGSENCSDLLEIKLNKYNTR